MKQYIESLALECEGKCNKKTNHSYAGTFTNRGGGKQARYRCDGCGHGTMLNVYDTLERRRTFQEQKDDREK